MYRFSPRKESFPEHTQSPSWIYGQDRTLLNGKDPSRNRKPMSFRMESAGVSLGDVPLVLWVSVSCFIVILAQSAATSRAYALRYRERFDENLDLVGLALANAAAACSGTFVVNGSPTKTAMDRILHGSDAEGVLRRAPCPVLIAKEPNQTRISPILN